MVRTLLIALLLINLAGCISPEPFKRGNKTDAPNGWINYCERNPKDPSCSIITGEKQWRN